ncbi:MAG: hypothetical protein HY286_00615 [Planctomycetes bacterium]|nr:hypothetical protein [Planctomycetota bacterium]
MNRGDSKAPVFNSALIYGTIEEPRYFRNSIIIILGALLFAGIVLRSCDFRNPGEFLEDYRPELIREKGGKYDFSAGGYGWVHWEAREKDTFTESDVRTWLERRGWTFATRIETNADLVDHWHTEGFPIARLTSSGPSLDHDNNSMESSPIPCTLKGSAVLLLFKSEYYIYDSEADSGLPAYGHAVLSADGRTLVMYFKYGARGWN